ncbi:MAG: ABC transporter permease, partial [Omnitrophica WOR_2 bacterium]
NSLPRWLLPVSLALPLTYGFDAVRGFLLKTRTLMPISLELVILVLFMFIMIIFGLYIFNRLELWVRTRGTLSQH